MLTAVVTVDASTSSSSSLAEHWVSCHLTSWVCDKVPAVKRLGKAPIVFQFNTSSAEETKAFHKHAERGEPVYLWMVCYKEVAHGDGMRRVLQYVSSSMTLLAGDAADQQQQIVVRRPVKMNVAVSGTVWPLVLYKNPSSLKANEPATVRNAREQDYESRYSAALAEFVARTYKGKALLPLATSMDAKTTATIKEMMRPVRDTPYGPVPACAWFRRIGSFALPRLAQHADELVFNLLHLISLSCPSTAWKGVESTDLLARVILFIPRLIGWTADSKETTHGDLWTSPLGETDLSLVSVDCEEMSGIVAIMCDVVKNTQHRDLKWMRDIMKGYVVVHALTMARGGDLFIDSNTALDPRMGSHVVTLLMSNAYWKHLTTDAKASYHAPGSSLVLEVNVKVCPTPCKGELDSKLYVADGPKIQDKFKDVAVLSSAQLQENKFYGQVYALYPVSAAANGEDECMAYIVSQGEREQFGCSFFDLWFARTDLGIRVHRFDAPISPAIHEIMDQSAYFCSLSFDRSAMMLANSSSSRKQGDTWKNPVFATSGVSGDYYVCDHAPYITLQDLS